MKTRIVVIMNELTDFVLQKIIMIIIKKVVIICVFFFFLVTNPSLCSQMRTAGTDDTTV